MIFTLDDFEDRIEEYANLPNFIDFLQDEADWNDLLEDFKKFPCQNVSLVDEYIYSVEAKNKQKVVKLFEDIFIEKQHYKNITIYTDNTKDTNNLIDEIRTELSRENNGTKVKTNKTWAYTKNFKMNWHDREIVSYFAMVIAGSGFKKEYKKTLIINLYSSIFSQKMEGV